MADESIKKKVFVGDEGQRATVEEEDRDVAAPIAIHTKNLVAQAGAMQTPTGAEYLGSAVVHYYSKKELFADNFFVACQVDVKKVAEGHADVGWKQLKSAFMKAYGRAEPKMRN